MNHQKHEYGREKSTSSLVDIRRLLLADDKRMLRIAFHDGDIFRLRAFHPLEPSMYGFDDQWTATVVEPIEGKHPDFHCLFRPGSGLDFLAADITEIVEEESGAHFD